MCQQLNWGIVNISPFILDAKCVTTQFILAVNFEEYLPEKGS